MSAIGPHRITQEFECEVAAYTGAPYCAAVDNASNALWLSLTYENINGKEIEIPSHTYVSVPCEVIIAGGKVKFAPSDNMLTGEYQLKPTRVWDSALRFTADMYRPGQLQCLSFTGPYKHLKLGKGGAILTDDKHIWEWFKRARNSGRNECSYHEDNFTMIGRNCYMMPQVAAQGLLLMKQFYNLDGSKKTMPDLTLPYPDLSRFPIYTQ